MERMIRSSSHSGHELELLADLYEESGDEEARLRVLGRLAQYWLDKVQDDKPMRIVKRGVAREKGAKEKLYSYIPEHYGDAILLKSLEARVRQRKYRYYNFANDETYRYLMKHYKSAGNYAGIVKLLNLRLEHGDIDFDFYIEAKEILNEEDWHRFEKEFIDRMRKKGWIM